MFTPDFTRTLQSVDGTRLVFTDASFALINVSQRALCADWKPGDLIAISGPLPPDGNRQFRGPQGQTAVGSLYLGHQRL